jgi:transcriptional regulator with XRE-family HTH domain
VLVKLTTVAARLKYVRQIANLRQNELATLAELKSSRHVGLIEEGQRDNLTAATSTGLCRALGMTLDWFLTGKDPAPTKRKILAAVERARQEAKKAAA